MKIYSLIVCIVLVTNCSAQVVKPVFANKPKKISKPAPEIKQEGMKFIDSTPGIKSTHLPENEAMKILRDTVPGQTNIIIKRVVTTNHEIRMLKGKITDRYGNPVSGVSIVVKGGLNGTITDNGGRFSLKIQKNDLLKISDNGYVDFELSTDETNTNIKGFNIQTQQTITNSHVNTNMESNLNIFPIPYPTPSAAYPFHINATQNFHLFSQVDAFLRTGLDKCRYDERRYYYIPHGFALVTQMEQISLDGISLDAPDRWSSKIANDINDPWDYIKALFTTSKGYFRVLVFLFTDIDVHSNSKFVSKLESLKWLNNGYSSLPSELRNTDFTNNYQCTLLVYHYEKQPGTAATMFLPSKLSGKEHFIRSTLANYIK